MNVLRIIHRVRGLLKSLTIRAVISMLALTNSAKSV